MGQAFYKLQQDKSVQDKTVYVDHQNLGTWLKPYRHMEHASQYNKLPSGRSLMGGEWIAAFDGPSLPRLWCRKFSMANQVDEEAFGGSGGGGAGGYLQFTKAGQLVVGTGLGPPRSSTQASYQDGPAPGMASNARGGARHDRYELRLSAEGSLAVVRHSAEGGSSPVWSTPPAHDANGCSFITVRRNGEVCLHPGQHPQTWLDWRLQCRPTPDPRPFKSVTIRQAGFVEVCTSRGCFWLLPAVVRAASGAVVAVSVMLLLACWWRGSFFRAVAMSKHRESPRDHDV